MFQPNPLNTGWRSASALCWILSIVLAMPLGAQTDSRVAKDSGENEQDVESTTSGAGPCPGGTATTTETWRLQKATLEVNIVSATTSQQAISTEVLSLRDVHPTTCGWPRQRSLANVVFGYDSKQSKSKPGSTVNRIGDIRLQHLMFLSDNSRYATLTADSFHNSSIGIYFQQSLGAGLGRLMGQTEIDADVRVLHQRFYDQESEQLVGALLSLRRSFVLKKAVVTTTVQALPIFNETDAWQARGVVGITAPLSDTFALSLTAFNHYVNNAPDKYRKNYFKLTFGIQFVPK